MDDDLVKRILNMYKSPEPFAIVMPAPRNRRQVKEDRSVLDEELCSGHVKSETEYVKEYVQKDEEEYIKVISIKIRNDIVIHFIRLIHVLPVIFCS